MKINRVVPNIRSDHIQESRDFYEGFLGLHTGMDLGWVITFVSRSNSTAQVSIMHHDDHLAALHPEISIEVDDVEQAHAAAIERNLKIVYALSDEPWGVKRFFVADPNGVIINILSHARPPKRSNNGIQVAKRHRKTATKPGSRKRPRR